MEIPRKAQTPPPSPDVWDMPSTPSRDPNDLSGLYPLPRTSASERFAHLDFSRLVYSPTTSSNSINQQSSGNHFNGQVDDVSHGFNVPSIYTSTGRGKHVPPLTATFGRDRENQSQEMNVRHSVPFVPIKPKSKVLQLSGGKFVVNSQPPRSFQVINEIEYRSLDAGSRKRFQVAYENSEGTFYASNDVAEPVEQLIRTRREEWGEFVRNHRQMR